VAELHDREHVEAHHLGVGHAIVVEKAAPFAEAGVVDEKVDREAPAADLFEEVLGRAVRSEIECDDLDLYAAGGTKLGCQSLEAVLRPRGENEVRPARGEIGGDGPADSRRGAGHQRKRLLE
jgi:hypothetical protein